MEGGGRGRDGEGCMDADLLPSATAEAQTNCRRFVVAEVCVCVCGSACVCVCMCVC